VQSTTPGLSGRVTGRSDFRLAHGLEAVQRRGQPFQSAILRDEIAQELSLSLDSYRDWLIEVQNVSLEYYDSPQFDDDEPSVDERLAGSASQSPERLCERQEARRLLSEAISQLPPREQQVLSLYFQHEVSPSEIAQIMNLRPPRVSQLKAQGLLRLRNALQGRIVVRS
jgi:RNA polymerase sigma factor for flagellar operon FliA